MITFKCKNAHCTLTQSTQCSKSVNTIFIASIRMQIRTLDERTSSHRTKSAMLRPWRGVFIRWNDTRILLRRLDRQRCTSFAHIAMTDLKQIAMIHIHRTHFGRMSCTCLGRPMLLNWWDSQNSVDFIDLYLQVSPERNDEEKMSARRLADSSHSFIGLAKKRQYAPPMSTHKFCSQFFSAAGRHSFPLLYTYFTMNSILEYSASNRVWVAFWQPRADSIISFSNNNWVIRSKKHMYCCSAHDTHAVRRRT